MVDDYFPLMDQVADRVEELEDTIFIHFDEGSIETIFKLKKDLLSMRRIVAPERDVSTSWCAGNCPSSRWRTWLICRTSTTTSSG